MAIYKPQITEVLLTPNPVNINASLFVSIKAMDVELQMYRKSKIAGDFNSNEKITLNTRKEVV